MYIPSTILELVQIHFHKEISNPAGPGSGKKLLPIDDSLPHRDLLFIRADSSHPIYRTGYLLK